MVPPRGLHELVFGFLRLCRGGLMLLRVKAPISVFLGRG